MLRKAICAGTWYPNDIEGIKNYLDPSAKKEKIIAGICPHAGWIYSGKTAGEVYSLMEPSPIYILIGPNHTGMGSPASLYSHGKWQTPLGDIEIEGSLAKAIINNSDIIESDFLAHNKEHSLEVQMPFIMAINPKAKIVPIALSDYNPKTCRLLGESIAQSVKDKDLSKSVTFIASTDMSHYVSADIAKKLDALAIERILNLDADGLLKVVRENNISMCGSGPTAAVIWAAKALGAKTARLIRYSSSGEITGDYDQVVGYAGLVIS